MSLVFASLLALAPASSPAAADRTGAAEADDVSVVVPIDMGPPLVRNMGLRLTVRREGDDPVMHRPVDVFEIPRPASSDVPPAPLQIELPPGDYIIEAEAEGFLPSTRAVSVRADPPPAPVSWQLLPSTAHRTVRISVVLSQRDVPVSLTARPLDREQPPVSCTARRVPCEFRLRRGAWELQATAPGHPPLQRSFVVEDAEEQDINLSFVTGTINQPKPTGPAAPPPAAAPDPRRKLVLGLSLAAVPLLATGLPLTVVGPVRYRQQRHSALCDTYGKTCSDALIPQIHLSGVGAGLLGAAVGVGATAVTAARARTRTPWIAEIAVGGALVLGGGAWMIGNTVHLNRDLKTGPLAEIDARSARRPVPAFLLGAGLGLVGGGLTGLLVGRTQRVAGLAPFGGPDRAGLALHGKF
ncbi:MAG TPA: hypothetical protein VIK91_18495 [Nannocystis sp.]